MRNAVIRNAWLRILTASEGLYPGSFALVMATGALSIALDLLHYTAPSRALFALNVVAYGVLSGLLVLRIVRFRRRIAADFADYARAPGFFTIVAGTCVLCTNIAITGGAVSIARSFWIAGIVLWVVVMYSFFTAVVTRVDKPNLESGINGAWLIAAVATQSVVVLGAVLAPAFAQPEGPLFFCLVMYLVGAMLYLSIITLIFY
ncbi:MAG: tellurite resistance/C4-dicarboxylate transporter family protein, partial [Steroidobacteraceae bacterium]